jgi:hypothetical protein
MMAVKRNDCNVISYPAYVEIILSVITHIAEQVQTGNFDY